MLLTGAGKSLCYIVLPLMFDFLRQSTSMHSIVDIVSPLKSLMDDQVAKFSGRGSGVYKSIRKIAETAPLGDFITFANGSCTASGRS